MQHLGIPLDDLHPRRNSVTSNNSDVSENEGILGVFSAADTSVIGDWLPDGAAGAASGTANEDRQQQAQDRPILSLEIPPSSPTRRNLTPSSPVSRLSHLRTPSPAASTYGQSIYESPMPPAPVLPHRNSLLDVDTSYHDPHPADFRAPSPSRASVQSVAVAKPVGRSCFLFGPNNALRENLYWIHIHPYYKIIRLIGTLLQAAVLLYQTIKGRYSAPGATFLRHWEEALMLVLYIIWSLHAITQIIAFGGFTCHVVTWSVIKYGIWKRYKRAKRAVLNSTEDIDQISIHNDMEDVEHVLAKDRKDQVNHDLHVHQPFFRKSWNRVEFMSILFYWLALPITATHSHVGMVWQIFYGMSNLRLFWLLSLWENTQVIYHSLKIAFPLLTDVFIFLALSSVAFSVASLQSFSASLSRTCVWVDPAGIEPNYTTSQICGSYLDPSSHVVLPYLDKYGLNSYKVKGFTCPLHSYCVESDTSMEDGIINFDNIFQAIQNVFVVMSNNTYSDIMYAVIDAEQAASCLFFIMGVIVLNYWMISLLVSVLSSSFDIAWAARPKSQEALLFQKLKKCFTGPNFAKVLSDTKIGRLYIAIYPAISLLICLDVCFQAVYSPMDDDTSANTFLYAWQIALSFFLLVEILFRAALYGRKIVGFFRSPLNIVDLLLGIINVCIIWIYYSDPYRYGWLSFFQLLRFYRFVILFPVAERMFKMVFKNLEQMWKLTCFYFILTLLASMIACRMFIGKVPFKGDDGDVADVSFFNLANSFFGMYQISSTENWTSVMYYVMKSTESTAARVFSATIFCIWLAFSNFIVVNLFISVMSGGFTYSHESMRKEQVRRFVKKNTNLWSEYEEEVSNGSTFPAIFKRVYRDFLSKSNGDDHKNNPLSKVGRIAEREVLLEFLKLEESEAKDDAKHVPTVFSLLSETPVIQVPVRLVARLLKLLSRESNYEGHLKRRKKWKRRIDKLKNFHERTKSEDSLLAHRRNQSQVTEGSMEIRDTSDSQAVTFETPKPAPDLDLSHVNSSNSSDTTLQRQDNDNENDEEESSEGGQYPLRRRDETRDYLESLFTAQTRAEAANNMRAEDASYEKSLGIFSTDNKIRQFCQKIVPPSRKKRRLSGIEPNRWVWGIFWTITFACSVAVVVISCINTPIYHIQHTTNLNASISTWTTFTYMDLVFTCLFFVEFMIKVIADGFHFTQNAYTYSPWNVIDMLVLMSMIVTVINNVLAGPVSRYSRAFMAFRALRFIAINPKTEEVFTAMFFSGIGRLVVASFIGLSVVFPYSVWGLNIFHNRLDTCSDGDVDVLMQCYDEYTNSPFNWDIWAPRYVKKPYFDYDSFGQAMLIQFGVLSLEGWIDVLNAVTSIQGTGLSANAAFSNMFNGLYPILYNFIGTVLIMTMFLSTIIRNYALSRITSVLTSEQLTWHYMKRSLIELRPKIQLPLYPRATFRYSLLKAVVNPRSLFNIFEIVVITVLSVIYFMYHNPMDTREQKGYMITISVLSLMQVSLSVLKLLILRWRVFIHDWWNVFFLGTNVMLCMSSLASINGLSTGWFGVQKAATLLSIAFWIPKIAPIRRLFRAATINFAEFATIITTYFVFFLTFAIAFNQTFGLTKLGAEGSENQNFRTVTNALILLFKMSTGEGWNQILVDYHLDSPFCTAGSMFFESDCGSKPAANILFIAWNIISMYIFANLFISVVYDIFWYIYRRTQLSVTSQDLKEYQNNWQLYDPSSKGTIYATDFYSFMRTSKGYFSLGIYSNDPDYNISTILERSGARRSFVNRYDVDYEAINRYLMNMPTEKFMQKRKLFELFCHQALYDCETGGMLRKIKFQTLLLQFPLYKDMDPSKVMELTEFVELKINFYQIKLVIASNFIVRRWRLRKSISENYRD